MGNFVFHFVSSHRSHEVREVGDAYSVRHDRPALWLQRACAWVLGKLGAFYQYEHETVERRVIRPDDLMEAIYQQRQEVFEVLGRGGETLLIGPEEYGQLMKEVALNSYVEFRADYRSGRREVLGLTVKIVPWMSGVLVTP